MNFDKIRVCEVRKISVDELLKEKPEQLPFLLPIENEPDNYTLEVNRVTVHDVRSHKIIYGSGYAIIRFFNRTGTLLASVSAFGSSEGEFGKPDESFYFGLGSVISETSLRVMNNDIK